MNCTINLFNTILPNGTTTGGTWELVGYAETENGTYGSGGNFPFTSAAWNVDVDFNNVIAGWYKLNYYLPDPCGGSVSVKIPVVGGGDAGVDKEITLEPANFPYKIFDQLGAKWDDGLMSADFSWSGSGTNSVHYDPKNLNSPKDDTYNRLELGTFVFILTITPQAPVGWLLNACPNCQETTATYTVHTEGVLIELVGCEFTATINPTCSGATYEWQQYFGGSWHTMSSGSSNTWIAQNSFNTRCRVTGCPGSPLYSNHIFATGCANNCTATLSGSVSNCVISWTLSNCSSNVRLYKPNGVLVNTGGTTGTYNVNINGIWTLKASGCPNCPELIKTVNVTGCATPTCNCSTNITENNCVLTGNDSNCSGYTATWYWFNPTTGNWENKGGGTTITVDNNGTWKRELTKTGCPLISATIDVSCVECIGFTSFSINNDCNKVDFSYSGASGNTGITKRWFYPTTNITDCNNASGWVEFFPSGTFSANNNGTGNGTYTIPDNHQDKCIKLRLEDTTTNCGWVESKIFVPYCCDSNPSIVVTGCNPYTLTVQGYTAGSTFLWSNGATTDSIDVYDGTYSVTVTESNCSTTLTETVVCCSQPCTTKWTKCNHIIDFPDYDNNASGLQLVIRSLKVNGVEYVTAPHYLLGTLSNIPIPNAPFTSPLFSPNIINGINAIAPNSIVAIIPEWQNYLDSNITNEETADYTGVVVIKKCDSVNSIEIIRSEYNSTNGTYNDLDYNITLNVVSVPVFDYLNGGSTNTDTPNTCVDENIC